jgi:hypothetical protein
MNLLNILKQDQICKKKNPLYFATLHKFLFPRLNEAFHNTFHEGEKLGSRKE